MFIQHISTIFGYGSKDEIFSVVTYCTAVSKRSIEEFEEMLANIEFSTKPLVMSTLQMYKDEGRKEGRKEGKTLRSLSALFGVMQVAPGLNKEQLSIPSRLPVALIEEILSIVKTGNAEVLLSFLQKRLPEMAAFTKNELEEIKDLISQICAKYKE